MTTNLAPRRARDEHNLSRPRERNRATTSLSLLIALLMLTFSPYGEGESIASAVQPSVVGVNSYRATRLENRGSGFVVQTDAAYGYVVTSANLLVPGGTITVNVPDSGAELIATALVADESNGFALLRVNGLRLPSLTVGVGRIEQGDLIWSADFLARDAAAVGLAKGSVSRTYIAPTSGGQIQMMIHNAPLTAAGIGAPLLNECGEVIGVTISSQDSDAGVSYALGSATLVSLLGRAGLEIERSASACLSLVEQARRDAELATTSAREAKDEAVKAMSTAERLATEVQQVTERNEALQRETREARSRAQRAIEEASGAREDAEAARAEVDRRTNEIRSETESMLQAIEEERRIAQERLQNRLEEQRMVAARRQLIYWSTFLVLAGALAWAIVMLRRRSTGTATAEVRTPGRIPTALQGPNLTEYILDGEDENGIRYLLRISGDQLSSAQGAVIGRNPPDSPYVLNHSDVSRKHARMRLVKNRLFIEDLGSTNGTTVNGQSIDRKGSVSLSNGDQIIMGSVVLRLRSIPA